MNDVCTNGLFYYRNHSPAKLTYLNFHPLEVVSRYGDQQFQMDENYSFFNLSPNLILMFKHTFRSQSQ